MHDFCLLLLPVILLLKILESHRYGQDCKGRAGDVELFGRSVFWLKGTLNSARMGMFKEKDWLACLFRLKLLSYLFSR